MRRLLAFLLVLTLSAPVPTPALADPPALTRAAALELLAAVEGLAEAEAAEDQVAALTRTILAHEAGLQALSEALADLARTEAMVARQFDATSVEVSRLLGALMAVSRTEGPALLVHPAGPEGTARAGMMLADVAPTMQGQADRLGARLADLRELQLLRAAAESVLTEALDSLRGARSALGTAIAASAEPPPPIGQDEALLLALLESAETLEALSAGLGILLPGGVVPVPEPGPDPGPAQPDVQPDNPADLLPLPVRGVLRQNGLPVADPDDPDAPARPGLVLATADGALVTAPFAGVLRYRGTLQDYGNVILLEPGDGYLLLMAGLDSVYPEIGASVPAGAPLGLMPTRPDDDNADAAAMPTLTHALYLELRYRGQPIDPGARFDLTEAAP